MTTNHLVTNTIYNTKTLCIYSIQGKHNDFLQIFQTPEIFSPQKSQTPSIILFCFT